MRWFAERIPSRYKATPVTKQVSQTIPVRTHPGTWNRGPGPGSRARGPIPGDTHTHTTPPIFSVAGCCLVHIIMQACYKHILYAKRKLAQIYMTLDVIAALAQIMRQTLTHSNYWEYCDG